MTIGFKRYGECGGGSTDETPSTAAGWVGLLLAFVLGYAVSGGDRAPQRRNTSTAAPVRRK